MTTLIDDENVINCNFSKLRMSFVKRYEWIFYVFPSTIFASLTAILGKIGIESVNSNMETAIRTVVVLIMAWMVVFVTGKQNTVNF